MNPPPVPSPASLTSLLARWRADPNTGGNVVEWRSLPARPARLVDFPAGLPPSLQSALASSGITHLYSHQAAAWELAQTGQNLVVVTGTASGKTLCYNLPVLAALLGDPSARAIYMFPTKALAQDQLAGVRTLIERSQFKPDLAIPAGIYDGDTPSHARPAIRKSARLLLTNPDMLHTGILPHHTNWAEFFGSLRFVVIDELHTYRGVFGSHVANVLRRLKRIARHYGTAPQYILTSATIANPQQLAEWLVEEPVAVVEEDGSARGPRHFLIYNPPVVNKELGLRRSSLQDSVRLAGDLIDRGIQTVLFGISRRSVEVMLRYLREGISAGDPNGYAQHSANEVRGYRSGYLPGQRREVERGLRQGRVRAVVATNALELGVDIGGMGAAILAGYPGSISSTWQQAGRAGRGEDPALAVLVASPNPLDQFLARHPEYFFGRPPEQGLVNPDNLLILLAHLRCAAFELPFTAGEGFGRVPPELLEQFLQFLQQEGLLHRSGNKFFWMADRYPAQGVSLRSSSAETIVLQIESSDSGPHTLGEIDLPSAHWMVHPGAIYLHEASTFLVDELDFEHHLARLVPAAVDYYTEPRLETTVALEQLIGTQPVPGGEKAYGEIKVTSQLTGFRKVRWHTHENLGFTDLALPPADLHTTGYWLTLAEATVAKLQDEGLWNSSPNDYGPLWPTLRQLARQRDGYRCQACGDSEVDRQHDVHHKIPFRSFASPDLANQLPNLVTLCHACHHRVEAAVRVRSGLGGLAFALYNLAPLFLLCDSRDIGVHSDPQSPLGEGRPAVVIFDRVPAGIGFSERLYEAHRDLNRRALELIEACECADGCPSCTGPGGENGAGGKAETLAILRCLLG